MRFGLFFIFFLLPLIRLIYLIRRLTLDDITILEDNSVRTEKLRVCDVDWRFEVKLIDVGNPVGFSARVEDPYSFFTDPDPDPVDPDGGQYGSGSGSNPDPGLK
jgi:hypothetical protein